MSKKDFRTERSSLLIAPTDEDPSDESPMAEIKGAEACMSNKCASGLLFFFFALVLGFAVSANSKDPSPPHPTPHQEESSQKRRILDPVLDLGLAEYSHYPPNQPSSILPPQKAYPTNAWYQNLLLLQGTPTLEHRAYVIPHLIDAAGPVAGLRVHPVHTQATATEIQAMLLEQWGLTLGVHDVNHTYRVTSMTPLGITLQWKGMETSIVRGMPLATALYEPNSRAVLAAEQTVQAIRVDGKVCNCTTFTVEHELELWFPESDFTWIVFVSEPVKFKLKEDNGMRLVTPLLTQSLGLRLGVADTCTRGNNPIFCAHRDHPDYATTLRKYMGMYPGSNTSISYNVVDDKVQLRLDWDAQSFFEEPDESSLATFALPHHVESLVNGTRVLDHHCQRSVLGPTCLAVGSVWHLELPKPVVSFRAPRPPSREALPLLIESLKKDLQYTLPDYFQRGAGDTYFSGKMLAKLARILLIAEEVNELQDIQLELTGTIEELKRSVEVWVDGSAETPLVYDSSWGGVVSCGCTFHEDHCTSHFPDCPGFSDPGLNFGNAFYNDQHFHYGYHIYAAAVASYFDPDWARSIYDRVAILVRSVANYDPKDKFFPQWRHKDWYQSHSWASGIATKPLNGRNQESSSEAIASYEAVSLYGKVMTQVWSKNSAQHQEACQVRDTGLALLATEIHATHNYWHVTQRSDRIVPKEYKPYVVGILWQTMAQFQTWFGNAPYLVYGIQLLPLTPIAEVRDGLEWAKDAYPLVSKSCTRSCSQSGWKVLEIALLATVGHRMMGVNHTLDLPDSVFEDPGGNGHSMSNTLWYVSTRPELDKPLSLDEEEETIEESLVDCSPNCTAAVLDTMAGDYTCRERMEWLVVTRDLSVREACLKVGSLEYAEACGPCSPQTVQPDSDNMCTTCNAIECQQTPCPQGERVFLCTAGASKGGCAISPWKPDNCDACCDYSICDIIPATLPFSNCPPCSEEECGTSLCGEQTPFLCLEGRSMNGCSRTPWKLTNEDCRSCCDANSCEAW